MKNDIKFNKAMMDTALIWSTLSSCTKLKVGAIIAYNDRIISNGYNGTMSGMSNQCEEYHLTCTCGEVHIFTDTPRFKESRGPTTHNSITVLSTPDLNSLEYYRGIEFDNYKKECHKCKSIMLFNKKELTVKTNEFTLHAEQNAILDAAKHGRKLNGSTIYVTHSPCPTCAKMIAGVGIKKVIYLNDYKDDSGIEYLKRLNIEIIKIGD